MGREGQIVLEREAERLAPASLFDRTRPRLSLCCMTSGRAPRRLAAILALFGGLPDEVVVAVEERGADAAVRDLRHVADRVVSFPHADPADSAMPWLLSECRGQWVLNIDDDEIPSPGLIERLPEVLRDATITHAWIARRWLYRDAHTHLAQPPWNNEFQLRLFRADDRFLRVSDAFHLPLVAAGPCRYIDEPLWHLDLVAAPFEHRQAKVREYERERAGMRVGPLSHNSGLYLPELQEPLACVAVPGPDRELIDRVLDGKRPIRGRRLAVRSSVRREVVDAHCPGDAGGDQADAASLLLLAPPATMVAGRRQTVDVRLGNESGRTWRWGEGATPEIRLAYRWHRGEEEVDDGRALRTVLPCDLAPGDDLVVPVHVVAPDTTGTLQLTIDVLHEHHRWFGCGAPIEVEVCPAPRVAVIGARGQVEAVAVELAALPLVEVVALDAAPLDIARVEGPREALLAGLAAMGRRRARAVLARRAAWLVARCALARVAGPAPAAMREIRACDAVVVAGPSWAVGAAPQRERLALAATVAAARLVGVPVIVLPAAAGVAPGLRRVSSTRGRRGPAAALVASLVSALGLA